MYFLWHWQKISEPPRWLVSFPELIWGAAKGWENLGLWLGSDNYWRYEEVTVINRFCLMWESPSDNTPNKILREDQILP